MGSLLNLHAFLSMIRRRAWLIAVVLMCGSLLILAVAQKMPRVYESAAVLQVELPRISADAALGTEALSRSSQRLQLLEQEITSRDLMLKIVADLGLFADQDAMTDSLKVQALRAAIRIETVRAGAPGFGEQPVSAILLVVKLEDPQQAANVANTLADLVVETTTARQSARAQETFAFYTTEEARQAEAIAVLEAEITTFKNENVDALPEGMQARREEVLSIEETLRAVEGDLALLRQENSVLTARGGQGGPRLIEQRQLDALRARQETLEQRRAELLVRKREVEEAIHRAPMVETQLGTFARRLGQLQEQFAVLTRRLAEAETGQRLDSERQTEHFTILERALPPDYSLATGRRKVAAFGTLASLLLGLGLAVIAELRRPVLRSARQMEQQLGLRPVISLPELSPQRAPPSRRLGLWRGRLRQTRRA